MKLFYKVQDSIFTILKYLLLLIFILFIAFIIKWRVDDMNEAARKNNDASLTIKDEVNILKKQYVNLTSKNSTPFELPKVELKDEESSKFITVEIKETDDLDAIGENLKSLGIIKDVDTFKKLSYDMAIDKMFKAGSYKIEKRDTVRETLLEIVGISPKTYEIEVTEEMGPRDIAELLTKRGIIKNPEAFVAQAEKEGKIQSFKPGKFVINTPLRVSKMIEVLTISK